MENKNNKVFICGASGLLGLELCHYFKANNINFEGTYNTNYIDGLLYVDFNSIKNIENAIKNSNATVCINCIVERDVDNCENEWNKIKNVNINISNKISIVCNKLNIHLIHISTDYVFDGKNPPYYPNNLLNPLNNYGISKSISEHRVISNCLKTTIIRVPVLYTEKVKNLKDCAITVIGKKILNRIEKSKEDDYYIRRPVYIPDFCVFIKNIILYPKYDIYHFYNPNNILTKYNIAKNISIFLNKSIDNHIEPILQPNVINKNKELDKIEDTERPFDTQLIDNKYNILEYSFIPFNETIKKCFSSLYHPPLIFNETPIDSCFFLLDLDGTLVDTETLHFNSYKNALNNILNYNLYLNEYENVINTQGMDSFLKNELFLKDDVIINIKKLKKEYFLSNANSINLINNAEKLINYINKYNINHVVVTNTNKDIVSLLKQKNKTLNLLKNWITREDYDKPKPNSECYNLALSKYGKEEKYIIGFENTITGYNALKKITKCIYIMTSKNYSYYNDLKKLDAYLIDDYEQIFNLPSQAMVN